MDTPGTPLLVDAGAPRGKLMGAAVLSVIAVGFGFLGQRFGFIAGMSAFIFGLAGVSVFFTAMSFSGKGPCPNCSAELNDVPRDSDTDLSIRSYAAWRATKVR